MDPEGEKATARAAAGAGAIMIASMAATVAVGDIAQAARTAVPEGRPDIWFQMYIQPDRDVTEALVQRATDAGCTALVVTVDSPVLARTNATSATGSTTCRPGWPARTCATCSQRARPRPADRDVGGPALGTPRLAALDHVVAGDPQGVLHP